MTSSEHMKIDVKEEARPSEHNANETQTDKIMKNRKMEGAYVLSNPTSSYQTFQHDSVMRDKEEPSTSEYRANETQTENSQYSKIRESLYRAAQEGDWQSANNIYKEYPRAVKWELPPEMDAHDQVQVTIWELPISVHRMNALQVAVGAKQTTFVKELLKCMTKNELKFKNFNGDTALLIASLLGNVKIAKMILEKNPELLMIGNNRGVLPLITAAMHGHVDLMLYLYTVTKFDELTLTDSVRVLCHLIFYDLYDKALEILKNHPILATAEDETGLTALEQLARKPFAIGGRNQMSVWERCIGYCFKGIYHKALMETLAHELVEYIWKAVVNYSPVSLTPTRPIFLAAELGNAEFLTIVLRSDPGLIWMVDENDRNIFHISIIYRHESIFNLIHKIGIYKYMIATSSDKDENNMLHLVGAVAPVNSQSGAALHMRRELLWFKEVQKIVPPVYLTATNSKGETPTDLFKKSHQKLEQDGEKWMRDTAKHFMLVATLVTTVVFAAAFTIPGGNDQSSGIPIFVKRNSFLVFFISDSIAFLFSSTSILVFLSILTSRFREHDFFYSLPRRLMVGLTALFISIVAMVVAFAAPCFLVYQHKMTMVPIVIVSLASVPIFSFVWLHYGLLIDIISSSSLSRFRFQSRKTPFFMFRPTIKR